MSTFRDLTMWSDNFTKNDSVQPNESAGEEGANFLSGESAVIVAGPYTLKEVSDIGSTVVPIGLVQQAQINQNKQINQIFEIGSRVPFFIPGRVNVNASLSKVLFDGPSLAYALYRRKVKDGVAVPGLGDFTDDAYSIPANPYSDVQAAVKEEKDENGVVTVEAKDKTASGLFWINLASQIFNKPLGLGFMLYDMQGQAYGGAYLEGCFLTSHRFGISSNATVLAENVSLTAKRVRPISAASMGKNHSDFYTRAEEYTVTST